MPTLQRFSLLCLLVASCSLAFAQGDPTSPPIAITSPVILPDPDPAPEPEPPLVSICGSKSYMFMLTCGKNADGANIVRIELLLAGYPIQRIFIAMRKPGELAAIDERFVITTPDAMRQDFFLPDGFVPVNARVTLYKHVDHEEVGKAKPASLGGAQ